MKIATMTQVFKGEDEPIFLVFQNDKERLWLIKILQDMPTRPGQRVFMECPDIMNEEGFARANDLRYNTKLHNK